MTEDGTQVIEDETSQTTEETSEETPKTFTEEEVKARVTKEVSDRLAAAGRDFKGISEARKAVEQAAKKAQELLEKAEARQRELDDRELENARDNPDMLEIIRGRQEIQAERRRIEQEKAAKAEEEARIKAELDEARQVKRQAEIDAIVKESGIDQSKLAELIDDTTDIDRIRKIASALPKVVTNTPRSDTGETSGGGQETEFTIKQKYINGKITMAERMEKLAAIGVDPIPK